jgi:hypothetical protein
MVDFSPTAFSETYTYLLHMTISMFVFLEKIMKHEIQRKGARGEYKKGKVNTNKCNIS